MNSVGNDNYRPNMVPPNPIKKKSGWLSSNMALLMVFLNGLILTVTAYATLSVFIQEIIKDDFLRSSNEIQERIVQSFQDLENRFVLLSNIVEVDYDGEKEVLKKLEKEFSVYDSFEGLFLVDNRDNAKKITTIMHGFDHQNRIRETFFSGDILKEYEQKKVNNFSYFNGVHLKDNEFILMHTIDSNVYFVVLIHKDKHLKHAWLESRTALHSINVLNQDKEINVFNYLSKNNKGNNYNFYSSIFEFMFVENVYEVRLNLKMGRREIFLQKIPLLMFLFGITLTLIGALYVRNNQRQSSKLSKMNKELAYKNFELSHEISERERLNKHIKISERENRYIINAVSDIIFEVDSEGTILFLNEAWEKITEFKVKRSIGRNFFSLLHHAEQEDQKETFKKLIKGKKKSYRSFSKLRSANGSYRSVELAFSMVKQDENKEIKAVGTITDVEERRRTEKALAEAEKKYRTIVENSANGIYQVTPEGQFLSVNPAFSSILGYDSPESMLRDIVDAHKEIYVDREKRMHILKDVESLKTPQYFESEVMQKNGSVIWVSENIRPVLNDDGGVLFYEGSIENIDQRRKAELALKEAKVESDLANRSKSEFLANMSHELRTPLNSVIGFAEIIKNEAFGKLPTPEYKEYATSIYESGKSLLDVINEILNVSHIETGSRDLKEGIISIKSVVASCIEMVKSKAEIKKINIDNKVTDDSLKVIGESDAVKQMLLNLLSNAIKFSPDRSYVMIDAEIDGKGGLCISITDTGIGLTESELEKALAPFGQVDTEHNRDGSGTGLGLTLVKSLIELHGGSFDMVSQKNIGTTATITFPKKRVSRPEIDIEKEQA